MLRLLLMVLIPSTALAVEPIRLTSDRGFKQHLQWSPDGKTFLVTRIHKGKMAVWTLTADGKTFARLLPDHREPHFDASWSADGKKIAYVYDKLEGTDGKLSIRVCDAEGSNDKTVIPHKAFEESPRWKPDGKSLLWVSTRHGNPELYSIAVDGKNETRLTSEIAADLHPAWSPDGKKIAFSSGRTGKQKLFVMEADGSNVKRLTDGDHLDAWPVWSPDGKRIAYVSNKSGNSDIWVMSADGTNAKNRTAHDAHDTSPTWSADGKKLAFLSTRDGGTDVYLMEVE